MDIFEFLKGDKFAENARVELMEVGKGYARARMRIMPVHLNAGGVCQGGAVFTLADLAFAAATNSHARLTFSVSTTINFLRSESSGYLYAEAMEVLDKRKITYCKVDVTNEAGELVAVITGTGYRKEVILPFPPVDA